MRIKLILRTYSRIQSHRYSFILTNNENMLNNKLSLLDPNNKKTYEFFNNKNGKFFNPKPKSNI